MKNTNKFSGLTVLLIFILIILMALHLHLQVKYMRLLKRTTQIYTELLQKDLLLYKQSHEKIIPQIDEPEVKEEKFNEPVKPKIQIKTSTYQLVYEMDVEATAYCPCEKCCGKYSDGKTCTGKNAYTKGVAVDPSKIPLGSLVLIPGYGLVEADDIGGAIKGDRIDVRFKTHRKALEWGRQFKRIKIFRK